MDKDARIFIADNHGLIGEAIRARLRDDGYKNLLGDPGNPSLIDAQEVQAFFSRSLPEYVFAVGGKSGGISANQKLPADLMLDNLLVDCHVIESAYRCGAKKLLYVGSSCCYPRTCSQPMQVSALMTKMHQAKLSQTDNVEVWGSGAPRREFIYVADVAEAAIFLMNLYSSPVPMNVGSGSDASIREIAELIKEVVGYSG